MKRLLKWAWRWLIALLPAPVAVLSLAAGRTSRHTEIFGKDVAVANFLIAGVAVLVAIGIISVARREHRFAGLEAAAKRTSDSEHAVLQAMRDELIRLEGKVHYKSEGRISLFRLDGDDLVLVARRSRMPTFDLSLGRVRHPAGSGILGDAVRHAHAEARGAPDPGPDAQPPSQEWIQWQEEHGLEREVAAELTMRSQNYVAFRLDLVDRSPGAIVFESTVSDEEAGSAGGTHAKRSIGQLQPVIRQVQERLAQMLDASCVMSADIVRERLTEQVEGRRKAS